MFRLFLGLFLLFSVSSKAATALDWKTLLSKAYQQNKDLDSLRQQKEAIGYQKSAVQSDYLPSLYLFADRTKEKQETSLLTNETTTDSYGLKASWNLFNGFSTYNSSKKYSFQEKQSEAQIVLKKADLRYALRKAVSRVLISQRASKTWNKLLRLQKDQLSVVQIKYNNGVEALWSVELSRANMELAKSTLDLEANNLTSALADLEVLLGEPLPSDFVLNDDLDQLLKSDIKSEVVEDHPQFVALQQQVDEAWADASIQKAGYLPSLKATLQIAKVKPEDQETTQDNQLGLTLTLPLFEGFSTYNQTSKTKALALSKEYSFKDSKLRLYKEVEKARGLFEANLKYLKSKELEVKATNMWSQTVEKQYRLGVRKYSDWDQAQTKMISSERDYLQSLRDTLESRFNLERLLAVTEEL